MKSKRKRIPYKPKNSKMATKIDLDIESVSVETNPANDVQTVTLVMTYSGSENLESQIVQGEQLTIEIPSHAPPPEPKK